MHRAEAALCILSNKGSQNIIKSFLETKVSHHKISSVAISSKTIRTSSPYKSQTPINISNMIPSASLYEFVERLDPSVYV